MATSPFPILAIATLKGGSGKSTVASCLAVHWSLKGKAPVLLDADPQRSLIRLAAREQALNGVRVVDGASDTPGVVAKELAQSAGPVIIDTPGFRAEATLDALSTADLVIVPVKASPLDVDVMTDTAETLIQQVKGAAPLFRCLLTQTTRDSVIARHIRSELSEAGFPLFETELTNRVVHGEAALFGATPSMLQPRSAAARDIAQLAKEVDSLLAATK
ncbi:MAG: division plane positioning ATPase MipZ [Rhodospirillaceae bacterium]